MDFTQVICHALLYHNVTVTYIKIQFFGYIKCLGHISVIYSSVTDKSLKIQFLCHIKSLGQISVTYSSVTDKSLKIQFPVNLRCETHILFLNS